MDIQEVNDIDITEEDIIADLLEAYPVAKPQPYGWVNAEEASDIWNVRRETARMRLEKLVKSGEWERDNFMSPNGQPLVAYRKKK